MATNEADEETVSGAEPANRRTRNLDPVAPKSLPQIFRDLMKPAPGASGFTTKEQVNGLQPRELALGVALTVLDLALTVSLYASWRHDKLEKVRQIAPDLLLVGLVCVALLALGTALRRRALLGFAGFIAGMAMIAFGLVEGVVYLGFGGWLIMRARKRGPRGERTSGARPTKAGATAAASRRAPTASKRYTPPRHTKTAAKGR